MKKEGETGTSRFSIFRKRVGEVLQKYMGGPVGTEETQAYIQKLRDELEKKDNALHQIRVERDQVRNAYNEFYNNIPVGYCGVDRSGRIIEANRTAIALLGVEKRIVIGTRIDEYVEQQDQQTFGTHLHTAFQENTAQVFEIRLSRKDASPCYVQIIQSVIEKETGEVDVCQVTIRDIHELVLAREALLRRESELALFKRVSRAFESTFEIDKILISVLEEVRRLLEVTACSIWLLDHENGELVCRHAIGPNRDTVRGWRLSPGQGIVGWVASTGRSLIVSDAWEDDRHFREIDQQTGQPLHSILSVPLLIKERVIGVLQVLDDERERFTPNDQALQEFLAALASQAIENARLHAQSQHNHNIRENLLHEINHRVTDTMAIMINLFSMVRRHAKLKQYTISRMLMTDMLNRVRGLKVVHQFLADLDWNALPLCEMSRQVIFAYLKVLKPGKAVRVDVPSTLIRISPEQSAILTLVLYELVSNTIKHALNERDTGKISLHITRVDDMIFFKYHDDGPGYENDILQFEHHNLGIYLIRKIVQKNLYGKVEFHNDHGAVAVITFIAEENAPPLK